MATEPEEEGDGRSTASKIAQYRREFLKSVGGVAGAAGVGYAATEQFEGTGEGDLNSGGVAGSLTGQKKRSRYFTTPSAAFDKSAINHHEMAIVTDDFGVGVKDANGNMVIPPVGSAANPAPSAHIEALTVGDFEETVTVNATSDSDVRAALADLPSNRDRQWKLDIKGDITVDNAIELADYSYIYLDMHGAKFTASANLGNFDRILDQKTDINGNTVSLADAPEQTIFDGGYFDGGNNPVGGLETRGSGGSPDYLQHRNAYMNMNFKNFDGAYPVKTGARRALYLHNTVASCDANAGYGSNGGGSGDQILIDCLAQKVTGHGFDLARGFQEIFHCYAQYCGTGFHVQPRKEIKIRGGMAEWNDNEGVVVEDGTDRLSITNMSFLSNGVSTPGPAIKTSQAGGRITGCNFFDNLDTPNQTTGIELTANASDVRLSDNDLLNQPGTKVSDSGTRTRWNGVIGGGVLGGVDTDAIADADVEEGDLAISNTVDEVLCRFDGSNWKAQGTVTGTYTGDGTATQSVAVGFAPEWVAIEEASGDYEVLRRGLSRAVLAGSSMPGSFSLTASGFDVGNGSGDQDPNTNAETYNFVAG